jgi:peptide/nickel transport system ATP-binding protein
MLNPAQVEAPPVLQVDSLSIEYGPPPGKKGRKPRAAPVLAVDRVSFELRPGESIGLIGESGSGKSTLGYGLVNLLPTPGRITGGHVILDGRGDLTALSPRQWSDVWGTELGMVFQGAQSMFNPLMTIGQQFADIFQAHHLDPTAGMQEAERLLSQTRLDAKRVVALYPHELSGGMRQRVAIVAAVMLHPRVLILDEPTTALDVVSQAQVLRILREIRDQYHLSMIFITHDFAVASNIGDRVAVMYAAELVEIGPSASVYHSARHPYTRGLIAAVPSLADSRRVLAGIPGQPPDMRKPPIGCRFADRCAMVQELCRTQTPPRTLVSRDEAHEVSCWRWEDDPTLRPEIPTTTSMLSTEAETNG